MLCLNILSVGLETSLTSKGLRPVETVETVFWSRLETSLTSKGLRPTSIASYIDEEFRNFPDFKGIKTQYFLEQVL